MNLAFSYPDTKFSGAIIDQVNIWVTENMNEPLRMQVLRNLYTCPQQPRHMSVSVDKFKYKLPYKQIFGGVTAVSTEHFKWV